MVRLGGIAIGLVFIAALLGAIFTSPLKNEPNEMYSWVKKPRTVSLASDGLTPQWDKAQLQRGMQVFKEVCSACHALNYIAFRNLTALGYDENQVKAFAAEFQVPFINPETGEPDTRPGLPSDRWPHPYPNVETARLANNNAVPPDLSLITKARNNGKNYVYSLLTGYQDVPADLPESLRPGPGLSYNPYFPNLNLAMAQPLNPGQVTYSDGTEATVDQMATDVTAFLVWAAEPTSVSRVWTGWFVLLFLLVFTVLAYLSYRTVWAGKKH